MSNPPCPPCHRPGTRAWDLPNLARGLTLGIAALLAACGGGADAPAPPPITELAAGQTAEADVPATGGTVTLSTREGARFELTLPDGALSAAIRISLSTATATASQRFHLRLAPAGTVLLKPATLTLTLPASLALPADGTLAYDGVPLAFTRLADGRLETRLGHLAGTPATGGGTQRALAVAAAAGGAAAPCGGVPEFVEGGLTSGTASIERYGHCVVGAVNALAASGQYDQAVQLASATAAYLQATGGSDSAGFIAQASTVACTAYAQALDTAAAGTVTSFDSLVVLVRPVLLWEMSVQKLGAVCTGMDPARYLAVIERLVADSLAYYNGQKGQVLDVSSPPYQAALREVNAGNAAVTQLRSLGAQAPLRPQATVPTLAREQIQQRAQPVLLEAVLSAPWQRCRDSGNFDKLIELMQLMDRPVSVRMAAQYCATELAAQARSAAGSVTATLDPPLGGVAAGNERSSGNLAVATDGKLELSGPIRALQCPAGSAGGSESLQLKLGNTVLQTITAAPYLPNTLQIDIAQALQAAGLSAASFTSGALTLHRVGSPCGGFWGDNPEPLLTLNLSAGLCAPKAPYQFCATALPVPVGDTQEPLLNDRGDLLVRSTQPRESYAYVPKGATAATPLPAGLGQPWNLIRFNARGDFLAGQAADMRLMAVWPAGATSVLPLPMPALPTGFGPDTTRLVSHAVLADDGAVIGAVQFSVFAEPGAVPAGCVALELCFYKYVVRWSPPYSSAPSVVDGPLIVQNDSSHIEITAINAAGVAVGLRPAANTATTPHTVVRWSAAGAETVSPSGVAGTHVHVDDRGTVVHRVQNPTPPAGSIASTGALAGVADPSKLVQLSTAGFAVACTGSHPQLVDTRDGRSWSLDPAGLVDPASGWSVDAASLNEPPCSLAGQLLRALPMNRQGHWIVRGSKAGNGSWLVLTPQGQPLP